MKMTEQEKEFICDELCRHPRECQEQQELDEICAKCQFAEQMEKKKVMRSRNKKENHIEVTVTGEKSEEIGMEIRAALRKMEWLQEASFCITMMDSSQ